ncbi:hypothetical protein NE237_012081 [Protea cynaroides]|uniref:Fibrillarin n=1 Tax=Protea cynaroides TaxID=273540 RepID=A0A9Q0GZ56_9MAGN|nr:hypothetical protein NE237_012081 [Protea cynaroides]
MGKKNCRRKPEPLDLEAKFLSSKPVVLPNQSLPLLLCYHSHCRAERKQLYRDKETATTMKMDDGKGVVAVVVVKYSSLCKSLYSATTMRPPMGRGGGGFRGRSDGGGRGRGRGGRGGEGGGRFGDGGGRGRGGGRFGGRGGGRGRGGRGGRGGGMKGGNRVVVEPHRHEGVFIAKGKEDALVTKNMVPGEAVYNEKRISVQNEDGTKVEYRIWNPFRSKLAAAILGGVDNIWITPGARVLYLGAASGTTVSHVSDIVGPTGVVYAVEFSHRSGRDLVNMAKKRTNIIPIIEDARHPAKYRMLVGMVDVVFSDVAQPDQARILSLNASYFLKNGGHFIISIKANCIDSTVPAEAVFAQEVKKLQENQFKPSEQVTLEPFERDHACVVGSSSSEGNWEENEVEAWVGREVGLHGVIVVAGRAGGVVLVDSEGGDGVVEDVEDGI